jgi:hypothetical protein
MSYVGMLAVLVCAALASGCASPPVQHSGYLGDGYSELKPAKDPRGDPILAYWSPNLNPSNYTALIVDPLAFYPTPKPTEQVSEKTLKEIGQYVNQTLRQKLGEKVRVVDQPGPGVARLSIAFTAVRGEDESLAVYQYIPFAFIATTATRAVEGTPQEARLLCEIKVVDSVSGQRLALQVRSGTGEGLKKVAGGVRVLTLESVKPLVDRWAEASSEGVTRYIRPK